MKVEQYEVRYERTWLLARGHLFVMGLTITDPTDRVNYAHIHYKSGKFWNSIGHKPSLKHHSNLRGEFCAAQECVEALMCELRMRQHERGTREYAEAYRDRWLPGIEIVDELPEGWRVDDKTLTQPAGTRWISNNRSLFGGEYEHKLMYVGGKK